MGYSFNSLRRILDQRNIFKGKRIITLGTLYPFLNKKEVTFFKKKGITTDLPKELFSKYLFVDVLGADCCHSLDVSDYQQSEIICNLNQPISSEYTNQYDIVIDAGTLEHLSNLPIALLNIFNLLKPGGIYYFGLPCNNWVDHGFFQFSPTFFYDLCTDNTDKLYLVTLYLDTPKNYYDYDSLNSFTKTMIFRSNQKIIISGIIEKKSDFNNFDLIQSKYRSQHNKTSIKENYGYKKTLLKTSLRRMAFLAIEIIIKSPYTSLDFKVKIINKIYKIAKKPSKLNLTA